MKISEWSDKRNQHLSRLEELLKNNDKFSALTPSEIIKFFNFDKENPPTTLLHLKKIYFDAIEFAVSEFGVGRYTAMDYVNTIFLKKIEGVDIIALIENTKTQTEPLINVARTKTEQISLVQKILLQILKNENVKEISFSRLKEEILASKEMEESKIQENIEKAIKMGAIVTPRDGFLSL
jgi:hypothetical protein